MGSTDKSSGWRAVGIPVIFVNQIENYVVVTSGSRGTITGRVVRAAKKGRRWVRSKTANSVARGKGTVTMRGTSSIEPGTLEGGSRPCKKKKKVTA